MKKKRIRSSDVKRLAVPEEDPSPFASIVLKEKKEEEKKLPPPQKKPSEIVKGYDPSASFADILYSYEHTGNPYSMPKPKAGASQKKTDFGDILDRWENPGKKKSVKAAPESRYKPTKDFGDILSAYEGKPQKKAEPKAPEKKEENEAIDPGLFRKKEEDDEISPSVSWSVFGGRNESFVREERKEAPSQPAEEGKRKRSVYKPTSDFADILSAYEGKPRKSKEEAPSQPVQEKAEEAPDPGLFRKKGEDDEISSSVSWSVFGGRNESFVREEKTELPPLEAKKEKRNRSIYKPSSDFGQILQGYEMDRSFSEFMKEKGDASEKRETLTISKLRAMSPQATLDLHGFTMEEAEKAVEDFLSECRSSGIRKISIITGKGLHSEDGVGVLKQYVSDLLDKSGCVTEKSAAPISAGGSGALWVILKA